MGSCSQPHNPRLLIWVPKALRPPATSCLQPHIPAFLYSFIQTNWMPPNAPARTFSQSLLFASVVGYMCKAHLSDRQLRWGTLKVQLKCPDISRDIFLCSSPFPCSKSSNTNNLFVSYFLVPFLQIRVMSFFFVFLPSPNIVSEA